MVKAILSPCIGVCTLDADSCCTGCFRSVTEIAQWSQLSDAQRAQFIRVELPQRELAFEQRTGGQGRAPTLLDIQG